MKQHGATVHFVVPEMDSGPIILQDAVEVRPDDTEATLAARVLAVEHRIYPQALKMLAEGRCRPLIARKSVVPSTMNIPAGPVLLLRRPPPGAA